MLGGRSDFNISDLPDGPLRLRLQSLPAPARERAQGWLREFSFPEPDVASINIDDEGGVLYVCEFPAVEPDASEPEISASKFEVAAAAVPVSPFPDSLLFHSRPGAPNVIFLDFDGATVSGTAWNVNVGRDPIVARPFNLDSDESTFSDSEQERIQEIWLRVAEDYAPFDVNVTTEEPAVWHNRVAHVLITRSTDVNGQQNPYPTGGGVAYINVFNTSNYAYYSPAWVYINNLASNPAHIAEASSHEAGHNLGLTHDGKTDGTEYYKGHGSGDTSWGTIMGSSYSRNVSQWSKGEYYLANNTQDDLAIIAGKLGYRPSDHGSTFASATFLTLSDGTNITSSTLASGAVEGPNRGIIERNNDTDLFSFLTGTGPVYLRADPWTHPFNARGNNLDLRLRCYDANGTLLGESNPLDRTWAELNLNLTEGVHYLEVTPVGVGDPFSSSPNGYTVYGSVGQYFVSGWVADPSGLVLPPSATMTAHPIQSAGVSGQTITVVYSDNVAVNVQTLDDADIRVTGPNGYAQTAVLVSVDSPNNGTPRTAMYWIVPPNGSEWTRPDNGTYTVSMLPDAVLDVEGAAVPEQVLGTFVCGVPTTIYEALMDVDPGWTLSGEWTYGTPTGQSGNPSNAATGDRIIGYNLSGNYARSLALTYATTPSIAINGTGSLFLQFQRWLGLRARDTATIEISINEGAWTPAWSTTEAIQDTSWTLVQLDLSAWLTPGAESVRIRWGMGSNGDTSLSYGWSLDDVRLLGSVLDSEPPQASLLADPLTIPDAAYYEFRVGYTDNEAVFAGSLSDDNLLIVSPFGTTQTVLYVGADLPGDGSPRVATYRLPGPGGSWGSADNGLYEVLLVENQVADTAGNTMAAQSLGLLDVAIDPEPVTWTLSVAVNDPDRGEVEAPDRTTFEDGDLVELTAVPYAYYEFSEWQGCQQTTENPLTVEMTADREVIAVFAERRTQDYGIPYPWLAEQGITGDFETAIYEVGANELPLWASYIAGLDPWDPLSRLGMESIAPAAAYVDQDGLVLAWPTVAGRLYTVVRASTADDSFAPVPGAVDLPATQNAFTAQVFGADARYGISVRLAD